MTVCPRRMAMMVPPVDCQNFREPMLLPIRGEFFGYWDLVVGEGPSRGGKGIPALDQRGDHIRHPPVELRIFPPKAP